MASSPSATPDAEAAEAAASAAASASTPPLAKPAQPSSHPAVATPDQKIRYWAALLILAMGRVLSFWTRSDFAFLPSDVGILGMSLNGHFFMAAPAWIDLSSAASALWLLRAPLQGKPAGSDLGPTLGRAALLVAFPLAWGLASFALVDGWYLRLWLHWHSALRVADFVLAFTALALLVVACPFRSRILRALMAIVASLIVAFGQEYLNIDEPPTSAMVALAILGVGGTMVWTLVALLPSFRKAPWSAIAAAALVGTWVCCVVVSARSRESLWNLCPFLLWIAGALLVRRDRWRWGLVGLALTAALALGASQWKARGRPRPVAERQVGTVKVVVYDARATDIALGLGKVVDVANQVSRDAYGISPMVRELVIDEIGPGGLRVEFPDRIRGNLPSEAYLAHARDSAYLENASIHAMDPVLMILHEYGHAFGVAPNFTWIMGPEEEGWATFAATRLALQLYRAHGLELWLAPYDYAKKANEIRASNLAGHPVCWSHPHEYSGYQLWQALAEHLGERELFARRWQLTQRKLAREMIETDPAASRRMIDEFTEQMFAPYSALPPVTSGEVIELGAMQNFFDAMGKPREEANSQYAALSSGRVLPRIVLPEHSRTSVDALAGLLTVFLGLLLDGWLARRLLRRGSAPTP